MLPTKGIGCSRVLPVVTSRGAGFIAISLSSRFLIKPYCLSVVLMAVVAPIDDFKFGVNLGKELAQFPSSHDCLPCCCSSAVGALPC